MDLGKMWPVKLKSFLISPTLSICLVTTLSIFYGSALAADGATRTFHTRINPDCETLGNSTQDCAHLTNLSLIHIRSEGPSDTLHFIYSFIGAPSLLLARTPLQSNLSIDWNQVLIGNYGKDVVSFDPEPFYVFGWSLVKVWFYDDLQDKGRLDLANQSLVEGYDTKRFAWNRIDNGSIINSTMIHLSFEAREYDHHEGEGLGRVEMGPKGFFRMTIRMRNTEDYSTVLPYMMYNENNTQVDIAFNDVQLNTTADEYPKHPRVAFKYIMVQDNGDKNESLERMQLEIRKTLDDEHSPGVFQVYQVKTPVKGIDQSYLEWRPICYTAEVRDVIDSVDVVAYPLTNASSVLGNDNIQDSILWSYFGPEIDTKTLERMNISFGTQGDGFYNKTKHISWTYTTGFGSPPADRVSLLVMMVVCIGLGIPGLIILLAVIYMVCRTKRPRDELLLGQ